MRRFIILLVLLFITQTHAQPLVRVLLGETPQSVEVRFAGAHRGYVDGQLRFTAELGLSWPLTAKNGQIYSDNQIVGHRVTLEPTSGELVTWQGKRYRGAIRFVAKGDRLRVINVVDLETYLRGVVPAEMQASWPLEAVKAQAVAARTYTLASLQPSQDYDVCATIECQVYNGVAAEHPRSNQAIEETRGVVISYGGTYAKTYYHSDSGGMLASSAEVWGNAEPYLVAQADVSQSSTHENWQKNLDPTLISTSLKAQGKDVGTVTAVRILEYTESGRVARLEVNGSAGSTVVEGTTLTKMLRAWGLKSTRFSMTAALTAKGSGWGHGVGMSQYGAKALAESNYNFKQILVFYYPGTTLQRLSYAVTN